jgi:hypothetical protein
MVERLLDMQDTARICVQGNRSLIRQKIRNVD